MLVAAGTVRLPLAPGSAEVDGVTASGFSTAGLPGALFPWTSIGCEATGLTGALFPGTSCFDFVAAFGICAAVLAGVLLPGISFDCAVAVAFGEGNPAGALLPGTTVGSAALGLDWGGLVGPRLPSGFSWRVWILTVMPEAVASGPCCGSGKVRTGRERGSFNDSLTDKADLVAAAAAEADADERRGADTDAGVADAAVAETDLVEREDTATDAGVVDAGSERSSLRR